MSEHGSNVWGELDAIGEGVRGKRMRRSEGARLVCAVWELGPGQDGTYHLHHGTEEILIVLQGRATLRSPEGERELEVGEVVHFPEGPDGAHAVLNRSDAPVRYLMAASHSPLDVIEYPDDEKMIAYTKSGFFYDSSQS